MEAPGARIGSLYPNLEIQQSIQRRHRTSVEDRAAGALIAWQRTEARTDPLSAASLLEVLLRIRGEAHDVRLVVFAVDLGAPPQMIEPSLVSAA